MPRHGTAFAMIVHESQGSEFDDILATLHERPATAGCSTEVAFAAGNSMPISDSLVRLDVATCR